MENPEKFVVEFESGNRSADRARVALIDNFKEILSLDSNRLVVFATRNEIEEILSIFGGFTITSKEEIDQEDGFFSKAA